MTAWRRKIILVAGVTLAAIIAAVATSERRTISQVCYDPGPANCLRRLQVPMDSSFHQAHLLDGMVLEVFGVPVTWSVLVFDVGIDFLAQVEMLEFNRFRKKRRSTAFGSIEAELSNRDGRLTIEARLEKPAVTQWLILED